MPWVNIPSPQSIKEGLDENVIGQTAAKIRIAIGASNHFHRINHNRQPNITVKIQKSNILLIGPTGSGKTLLAQMLATRFRAPFFIADATKYTSAGYIGDKVENMVLALLEKCDWNKDDAESGIIYIDEIDKITAQEMSGKDVNGVAVQQALLKILEGTVLRFPLPPHKVNANNNAGNNADNADNADNQAAAAGGGNSGATHIEVDTSNILFICGGAFSGLEKIIAKRAQKGTSMGFGAVLKDKNNLDIDEHLADIQDADLVAYGFIPEFVGRLTTRAILKTLSVEELVAILTVPRNSVINEQSALLSGRVELVLTNDGARAIATEAREKKTGARGLRTVVEELMLPIHYYGKTGRFVINGAAVTGRLSAEAFAASVEAEMVQQLESANGAGVEVGATAPVAQPAGR